MRGLDTYRYIRKVHYLYSTWEEDKVLKQMMYFQGKSESFALALD